MPLSNLHNVEYAIVSGHISIVTDEGVSVPAYWAHPRIGNGFSAVGLFHDWWGFSTTARQLANYFAQAGYYVIAPDFYNGKTASTPQEAMKLLQSTVKSRYKTADASLAVLEHHHQTSKDVAAIGLGTGGTLAFEAAIKRDDLEASIAYGGFPQSFLGKFARSNTPILAIYGEDDPFIKPVVIDALQNEFSKTQLATEHETIRLPHLKHEIFPTDSTDKTRHSSKIALESTITFLHEYLEKPNPQSRKSPM